jgi:hypothetical protein
MSPGIIKLIILMGIVCICSCTGPRYLRSVSAGPEEITGTCDLFLYGHRYADDFKNIAFLIPRGGKYSFELYAPKFNYVVRKGLPAGTAIGEAEQFIKFHYSFQRSHLNKILDYEGNVIGYELRPLYSTLDFSYEDVFDVHYLIEDDKVVATVGLKPEIGEQTPEPFLLRPRVR